MTRVLWLAVVAVLFTGCQDKNRMLELQKAAFEQKKQDITAEVDKVLQAWLDQMVETLPEDVRK
ncbi:hypothetical protein KBB45_02475, partial [Myxococcota bacterium]|nr:hypothetical protein [Myxococcota bacterium]